ncbi:MAG TPA: hypothetical protein VF911_17030 [Thermoanaerobaculia bacterium]|jgi:hypothetical protein
MILAVLYFGLIELLLIDSSRELTSARRYRSRVIAQTFAENAAEGAALHIVDAASGTFNETTAEGTMTGSMARTGSVFVLTGTGRATGLEGTEATVWVQGQIDGNRIEIHFAGHSQ